VETKQGIPLGTALFESAVGREHATMMILLLLHKVDVGIDKGIHSKMQQIAMRETKNGNHQLAHLLTQTGAVDDRYAELMLLNVIEAGNIGLVINLLAMGVNIEAVNDAGNTSLVCAAKTGNMELVCALLEKGANVDAVNNAGDTALLSVTQHVHSVQTVQLLIRKGANIHGMDNSGDTALLLAARHMQNVDTVELLLREGLDIEATNSAGNTPLWCAMKAVSIAGHQNASSAYGKKVDISTAIVKTLLDAGATVHDTVVALAVVNIDCLKALHASGRADMGIALVEGTVCVFGRNLHSRMPLVPTHVRVNAMFA
jgi:hypothetical protein